MKLLVYKGFTKAELNQIQTQPILDNYSIDQLTNIIEYNNYITQDVFRKLTNLNDDSWMPYELFAFITSDDNGSALINILKAFKIELNIIYNNIYPELYPCNFDNKQLLYEFLKYCNDETDKVDDRINKIYNDIVLINDSYYVRYNNIEYDFNPSDYIIIDKYSTIMPQINNQIKPDYIYEISEDEADYNAKINEIQSLHINNIGVKLMGDSNRIKNIYKSFIAFINKNENYTLTNYDNYEKSQRLVTEFNNIVSSTLKIPGFVSFKDLDFYENPNLNNKLIKINQTQIMGDMVEQAEKASACEKMALATNGKKMSSYRDIFVTAPTGSGKSLIFQVPAIYLEQKYKLLTIIITPLIELMNDQVRNLHERGYLGAERLNSSINAIEKKKIVENVSNGNINLLYLAPETLLSYSIDQLIGDRKIGLVIVDEAHIVSTWGKGFRPDYWYLGSYLNRLRRYNKYKSKDDINKSIYCFPICTFTATAVNGGKYDDVNDIKNSLNLRDTITYFGKVVRDDIKFDISDCLSYGKMNKDEYQVQKSLFMEKTLKKWLDNGEKAIVYFPYATTAHDAFECDGSSGFDNLKDIKDNFTIYTGGNNDNVETKQENMLEFRNGSKKIMMATKAFGMGIDIKDINNVYHYAASGNLNDYVQEIGRVARSNEIEYGIAATHYFEQDLNFMKTLYGMSALHNFQTYKILSIIYNVYKSSGKRKFLVSPDMFKPVFSATKGEELETKIKSALLTIEKDLADKYSGSRPINTRPRNMFTECYAMVDADQEDSLLKSKYGKYFKKVAKGRNGVQDLASRSECKVWDQGNIFLIDLKSLWEEQHEDMQFSEFKYNLNSTPFLIFEEYSTFIKLRNKITIKTIDDEPLNTLKEKLLKEINIVSDVLNNFQTLGIYFTKDDFAKALEEQYRNKYKASTVANSYLEMIGEYKGSYTQNFFEVRNINDKIKYHIKSGIFRSIAEKAINTSPILSKFYRLDSNEYTTYDAYVKGKHERDDRYDAINLALLFGLVSFEILGGNKPEIYIRINAVDKIKRIVSGNISYDNKLIQQAKERHDNDVHILDYFFRSLKDDNERWYFIEKYYLGKIITENDKIVIEK
jgi:ATP-dependent DNA helicase RecQ